MNYSFVGEFDNRYTVRMLDGTAFEMIYNEWMDDETHQLVDHVLRAADDHGICLRRHRVHLHVDETSSMIVLLQDPPSTSWMQDDHTDLTIALSTHTDRSDLMDYFEPFVQEDRRPLLRLALQVHELTTDLRAVWDRLAACFQPQTLVIGPQSVDAIRAFSAQGVTHLHLTERYDFNVRTIEMICEAMPDLDELVVTVRALPEKEWGCKLFHRTRIRLVRWRFVGYVNEAHVREMISNRWTDWLPTIDIHTLEVEWTRRSLKAYGWVIDDDDDDTI